MGAQLDEKRIGYHSRERTRAFSFDSVPSPLIYVSAGQVNAVVPFGIEISGTTLVRVEYQGQSSDPGRTADWPTRLRGVFFGRWIRSWGRRLWRTRMVR